MSTKRCKPVLTVQSVSVLMRPIIHCLVISKAVTGLKVDQNCMLAGMIQKEVILSNNIENETAHTDNIFCLS